MSGGYDYLPNRGSSVYRLTCFRMGLGSADGPARRGGFPGGAESDLCAIGRASGRRLFGAGPSPRNYCGKGLGETGCRQFAPPSVGEEVPDFLACPKDPDF